MSTYYVDSREYNKGYRASQSVRRRSRRRRSIINKKLFRLSFVAFLIVFLCVAGILSITAQGSERPVQKQFRSIQIEEGDTLWSIAMEYNDSKLSKNTTSEYIDDILDINNLVRDDKITAGNYIIVPVYVVQE
ncbi:MAG: LysM peptidoglycan-binding domain-containing protein [Lachnospiraceae bacterium]|nr:LysM peptidoglycan-binding domain-containing protein [Lachnospiraceae bacterium]